VNVEVTPLPGIGVRKDFEAGSGRRIGVVVRRDGSTDLIASRSDDPDTVELQVSLSQDEAAVLGNLLGTPQLVAQLQEEHRDLPGILTRQFTLDPDSPFDGRTLGATGMRTRTKASIVAVMRAGQVVPSPGPDFVFTAGDVLVVVGTADGLDAASKILAHG
jgi:TrkA domain protein